MASTLGATLSEALRKIACFPARKYVHLAEYMSANTVARRLLLPSPLSSEMASFIIFDLIKHGAPAMIGRFGSTEIKAVLWPLLPWGVRRAVQERFFTNMKTLSGFINPSPASIRRFSELMRRDMTLVDVLASWRVEEVFFRKTIGDARIIALSDLEPYLSRSPWSAALEGKDVLVVHPFSQTIESQYLHKRGLLFDDQRVLPMLGSLQTVRAVQTIAGQDSNFNDWFDALESMKSAVSGKVFDVAIIGCGAYGFPLAAHVKRMGKVAIHMGGATQLLFGIRGARWDNHPRVSGLYNRHWVRPSPEDVPKNAVMVENGCYW